MEAIGKLLEHLGYATPIIYAAAAYGFFAWLDTDASDEAKAALASTMRLEGLKTDQIASALVEVFDRLYTKPLLRWRAFVRSMMLTLVVSALVVFEIRTDPLFEENHTLIQISGQLALATVANIIFDYISLFLIRPQLVRAGNRPASALVTGAFLAMLVVMFGVVARLMLVMSLPVVSGDRPPGSDISANVSLLIFDGFVSFVFSLAGLLVFTWLPLFALGIVLIRILAPLSWVVAKAQWALKDGKEHPLKAVGYVAAIIVFVASAAWHTIS
jgi:hypothetical protein